MNTDCERTRLRDVSIEQLREDVQALIEDRDLILDPATAETFDRMIAEIRVEIEQREEQAA